MAKMETHLLLTNLRASCYVFSFIKRSDFFYCEITFYVIRNFTILFIFSFKCYCFNAHLSIQ